MVDDLRTQVEIVRMEKVAQHLDAMVLEILKSSDVGKEVLEGEPK